MNAINGKPIDTSNTKRFTLATMRRRQVRFNETKNEHAVILRISRRAFRMSMLAFGNDRTALDMDLSAAHSNGQPIDFEKLYRFDDVNFGHDISGIQRFIDRETGKLGGFFTPRSAYSHAGAGALSAAWNFCESREYKLEDQIGAALDLVRVQIDEYGRIWAYSSPEGVEGFFLSQTQIERACNLIDVAWSV